MLDDGTNLPIPNRERNNGGSLMIWSGHPDGQRQFFESRQWHKTGAVETTEHGSSRTALCSPDASDPGKLESESLGDISRHSRRKPFNFTLSTIVLSCVLFLVTAGLIATGSILGRRIAELEDRVPSFVNESTEEGSTTNETGGNSTSSTSPSSSAPSPNPSETGIPPPTPPTVLVSGWKHLGCYYDSSVRLLSDDFYSASNMTNARCAEFCSSDGRRPRYFGTQVSVQCFCGTANPDVLAGRRAPDWQCSKQCPGRDDMAETCGGNWALTIWEREE
ncbi:hypothetical protein P885DRAFT_75834 [Corynascus similis CBS 632.67]